MDLDDLGGGVHHPVLRDVRLGVEAELGAPVIGEGGVADLDQQEHVFGGRLGLLVRHGAAAPEDGDVRFGLGVVIERNGIVDGDDGAPAETQHEKLVEVVHEGDVAGTDGRHLDDLAADQLDPLRGLEDARVPHAVILLPGEQTSRPLHLCRHARPPRPLDARSIDKDISRPGASRKSLGRYTPAQS